MRINTSGIPNHNRISRGPNSPTTGRLNSLGGHDPNSPTFPRRPCRNSDASSIDIKRSDIDPALLATGWKASPRILRLGEREFWVDVI